MTVVTHQASPLTDRLFDIYHRLLDHFGPLHWWPAESPFEVIVGAVLTQNTAWTNVEKAIANLRASELLTLQALLDLPEAELAERIRSSGFYMVKAKRLRALLQWLGEDWEDRLAGGDLEELRTVLLAIDGVGAETADSILLYAANRPTFVVDAYTRRILDRIGIEPSALTYEGYRRLFLDNLPRDASLFNEFHAQLVYLGKHYCRKQPRCAACPAQEVCAWPRQETSSKKA